MAYDPDFLGGPLWFGSNGRQRMWTLDSTDAIATICGAGYLSDGVSRGMTKGDVVFVRRYDDVATRNALLGMSQHYVSAVGSASASLASDWDTSLDTDLAEQTTFDAIGLSSKASDGDLARFVAPWAFRIVSASAVLNGALDEGNATVTLAIGGVAVTGGVITVPVADSAAGTIATATPSAVNTGAAGALITATVGGASTATGTLNTFVLIERTS
jgi:hypothetical protein